MTDILVTFTSMTILEIIIQLMLGAKGDLYGYIIGYLVVEFIREGFRERYRYFSIKKWIVKIFVAFLGTVTGWGTIRQLVQNHKILYFLSCDSAFDLLSKLLLCWVKDLIAILIAIKFLEALILPRFEK